MKDETNALAQSVNDKARRIKIRGNHAIIPLKFDKDGNPAKKSRWTIKQFSLEDLRFLQALRKADWDVEEARRAASIPLEKAERLVRKVACFREEDARVKALCEIPTPEWIAAKHVENVYDGGTMQDSEHRSLQELAKIEGAYIQSLQAQVNIFNLPPLAPEVESELKALARKALDAEAA